MRYLANFYGIYNTLMLKYTAVVSIFYSFLADFVEANKVPYFE